MWNTSAELMRLESFFRGNFCATTIEATAGFWWLMVKSGLPAGME